jgi:plastocyanin
MQKEELMHIHPRTSRWTATALLTAALMAGGSLSGSAQEATPSGGAAHAHPAHIHVGSCTELDPNPTYMLTDVTPAATEANTAASEVAAIPVERSVTTVDAALEDLRTGGYAINIHQSAEDIGTYIACGNLSGSLAQSAGGDQGDELIVGLGELNGSGHSGIATLIGNGDQTDVTIYLAEGLSGTVGASAQTATTGDSEAAADAVMVDIKDLAYTPATVEVPVGGTVTWTNNDTVPHTVTAQDRALLQSGTLDPGATFSQTFDAPGTIDYFCEFHANMKGTIVVQ